MKIASDFLDNYQTKGVPVVYKIDVPKGSRAAMPDNEAEAELILDRNTKMKITRIERVHDTGRFVVYAKVLK